MSGFIHIILPVTPFQQNCSLLVCNSTKKAALIDPGGEPDRLAGEIAKQGAVLEKIFLTHGHLDHVGASKELADRFQVPIEGPHEGDKFWLDDLPNYAEMMQFPKTAAFLPNEWLDEGDRIHFGNIELEVLYCPGHTPGHLVFFQREERLAFVGDVIFNCSIGRTDFPGGSHPQLLQSIREKVIPLGKDVRFVPGHGPMSTIGYEEQHNPFLK